MESISKFILKPFSRGVLIATALFMGVVTSASADEAKKAPEPEMEKLQIKSHRFSRHADQDFERLVIEFSDTPPLKGMPVRLVSNPVEKNANISIDGLSLVGAIPEASINDSFVKKSKYLGAISINPKANSTVLKTSYKDATVSLDAFWLQNPTRMVIDAFPPASPRAVGPAVVKDHAPAKAAETKKAQPETKARPAEEKKSAVADINFLKEKLRKISAAEKPFAGFDPRAAEKPMASFAPRAPENPIADFAPRAAAPQKSGARTGKYVCYPATSQVNTSVTYENKRGKQYLRVETTGQEVAVPTVTSPDGVVCYPRSAELKATVHFTKAHPGTTMTPDGKKSEEIVSTTEKFEPKPGESAANDAPVSPKPVTIPTPLKRVPTSLPPFLPPPNGWGKVPPMPKKAGEKAENGEKPAEKDKKTVEE